MTIDKRTQLIELGVETLADALFITDWQTWKPHSVYSQVLHEQHKRKHAFWSKF